MERNKCSSQHGVILFPTGHFAMSPDTFGHHNLEGKGIFPEYSEQRPWMLINLLQCKGQAHNKIIKKEKKVV